LKILLISTQILTTPPEDYGGVEEVVALLAYGLAKRGHDVTVAAASGSKKIFENRFKNIEFIEGVEPSSSNPEEALFEKYKDRIIEFDVVNSHGWSDYPHRLRSDVWQTIHCPYPKVVSRKRNICVSKAHASFIEETYGFPATYVHNAVDSSRYEFSKDKEDYFLFLSRISEEKGALEFIKVVKEAGVRGIVAGDDSLLSNPKYVSEVIYQCQRNNIEYLGKVSNEEKVSLLKHAKALVAPINYFEVFGLYFCEALLSGTPVIVMNKGAASEIVEHGKSGFVANSLEEMVYYVKHIEEIKPEECRKRGLYFSIERMAENYEKVYKSRLEHKEQSE
jgi:glycosyltransferase involved in cell wall biosynthesis